MPRIVRTRREIIEMSLICLGFTFAICLIIWGVSGAVTGRQALGIPDVIEKVSPEPNENQVLSQTEVFVDLIDGYAAELVIDGQPIETFTLGEVATTPGQQLELPPAAVYDPGNYSIRFQPQDGAVIESWTRGGHVVSVLYWKAVEGRGTARSWTWNFTVL